MDDAALVRGVQRVGNLPRDVQHLVERQRALRDPSRQIVAVDELHHERAHAAAFFQSVNLGDMRMVQGRERLGLASETRQTIGIAREGFGKDLQRDVAIELRIARTKHLAHAAGADRCDDFVRSDARTHGLHRVRGSYVGRSFSSRQSAPTMDYRLTADHRLL